MNDTLKLHPSDNVEVLLFARGDIAAGHKLALIDIAAGEYVIKYGQPIGRALLDIPKGGWVHSHNLKTALSGAKEYTFTPEYMPEVPAFEGSFMGYQRADGTVGVRNEIWVIPTVGCVNHAADAIAQAARGMGITAYAFTHPYGCSQLGEDHETTQKLLAALVRHPNAGGVLVVGLGCENNHIAAFKTVLGEVDESRVKFLNAQDEADEVSRGFQLVQEINAVVSKDIRTQQPMEKLVIGLKCGGSDGFSGITANPLLGRVSDGVCAAGGKALLTEVPEMFGAEELLMARSADTEIFEKTVGLVNGFKQYYERNNQPVYENPSPGNKAGGITTLEEKSLGCTQKGGTGKVRDVLNYAQPVKESGLSLVWGPGNDICAVTALTAAGAQVILFTTGRGTPLGAPVPTLKVATNSSLAQRKAGWIDYNAGALLEGTGMEQAAQELLRLILDTASGAPARNEQNGCREIAIFKSGVTL